MIKAVPIHSLRVGVVGFDAELAKFTRDAAARLGGHVEIFGSLAELAAKGQWKLMRVLIIDTDSCPISPSQLSDQIEGTKPNLVVMLVGGAELSPLHAEAMPSCVKRIVVRESGSLVLARALQDVFSYAASII